MGRRKNNPDLVDKLIEGKWTMDQDVFEEKYYSLSSNDKAKVSADIYKMEDEAMSEYDDEDY